MPIFAPGRPLAEPLLIDSPSVMRLPGDSITRERGFSLVDMLAAITVLITMAAMSAPPLMNMVDQYRLGMATRTVERELQFAKMKAVSAESPMRVRFNCPVAGQIRAVE